MKMLKKSLCVVAFLATTAILNKTVIAKTTSGSFISYNDLLNAEGIFDNQVDFISTKSNGEGSTVLGKLRNILGQRETLERIYSQYKAIFDQDEETSEDRNIVIFKNNLIGVATHNLEARRGMYTWEKGVNQFTDLSSKAFEARYLGYIPGRLTEALQNSSIPQVDPPTNTLKTPDSEDWVEKDRVSPVQDQKSCNSCVMFASSSLLASVHAIKYKRKAEALSPQQLLDCAQPRKDICREGSFTKPVMEYLVNNGISSEDAYPLADKGRKQDCQTKRLVKTATMQSWSNIKGGEPNLKDAVARNPIFATIHGPDKQYKGGVYNECKKSDKRNHAVLVVGYGVDEKSGMPYWLIKNSYGSRWGVAGGYFKLQRNVNMCHIGEAATNSELVSAIAG